MAGLKQSKRVWWPTDGNLCKVRLFLSEDAPSQSGLGTQDNLQAKATWLLHAAGFVDSDDSLPPGFEAQSFKHHPKIETSQIPLINWQRPFKLVLNPEWLVVAGGESEEMALEHQRQSGVLEAIYPRLTSIPPNPFTAPDVQDARVDDSSTPLIPITAIEDEDGSDHSDSPSPPPHSPIRSHSQPYPTPSSAPNLPRLDPPPLPSTSTVSDVLASLSAEPDVLAAASAAFTAIMRSSEQGSLIDRDLLIKILSDPQMVERLVSEYSGPKQTPQPPMVTPPAAAPSRSPQILPVPNHVPSPALNHHHPHHLPHLTGATPAKAAGPVKDANYYKSLILLHGGEKQDAQDQNQVQFNNVGVVNQAKIQKPCAYFNTSRGCRHGASCLYLHDTSLVPPHRIEQHKGPTTKRIKLDGGVVGRN